MKRYRFAFLFCLFASPMLLRLKDARAAGPVDDVATVLSIVKQSTLDRSETKPFHLLAGITSPPEDGKVQREGSIEYWWMSPSQWRREVRAGKFHEVLVVNGSDRWQKDEGEYFPEWLRELAIALVRPVPVSATVLRQWISSAQVLEREIAVDNGYRHDLQTNVEWGVHGGDETHAKSSSFLVLRSQNTFLASSKLILTAGPGWGGFFSDYKDFKGMPIARTVSVNEPRTIATIKVLEDLVAPPTGFFDTSAHEQSTEPITTIVLDDDEFRQHMHEGQPLVMPPVKTAGPDEVELWADITVDRKGVIQQLSGGLAQSPLHEVKAYIQALKIEPFERNGMPVQAVGRVFITAKIPRPHAP